MMLEVEVEIEVEVEMKVNNRLSSKVKLIKTMQFLYQSNVTNLER